MCCPSSYGKVVHSMDLLYVGWVFEHCRESSNKMCPPYVTQNVPKLKNTTCDGQKTQNVTKLKTLKWDQSQLAH